MKASSNGLVVHLRQRGAERPGSIPVHVRSPNLRL